MQWSCYKSSLVCAAAFCAAEAATALGGPASLLAACRLLLLLVWTKCWLGAPLSLIGKGGAAAVPCGGGKAAAGGAVCEGGDSLVRCEADHAGGRRTWRSAGVPLPSPTQAMNLIKSRRSLFCKDMVPADIDDATLGTLLEAASWAPSHGRTEPWHFVVFKSPESRAALEAVSVALMLRHKGPEAAAVVAEEFAPGKRWANAACLIAICMRRRPRCCMPGGQPVYNQEWEEVAAVSCAVQNLHLMATALPGGWSGYWSSWYGCARDAPEMRSLLGLHDDDRCLGFFVLGHCPSMGNHRAARSPPSADWR